MKLHWREVNEWQWIMLGATVAISFFMLLANSAQAYYSGPNPAATTLSHCGWLSLPPARGYTRHEHSVAIIQEKLEHLGFSVGETGIDGLYGPRTTRAVKQFQARYHLPASGEVNGQTASMIGYLTHPVANVQRCRQPARMR